MTKISLVNISIILFILCLNSINAEVDDNPFIIQSVRTESMGSAFTAVADSEDVLFFNPAGLQNIQDSRLTMFGIRADFNIDMINGIRDFVDAYDGDSQDIDAESISELQGYSPLIGLAGPIQITYIRPHLGFMFLNPSIKAKADFSYLSGENQSSVKLTNTADVIAMLAYGRRVYQNLSAGLTLKYLARTEIRDTELSDLADNQAFILVRRGISYDLGLMYEIKRLPFKFGLDIRDILNTSLSEQSINIDNGDVEDGDDYEIKRQITLGISYQPDFKIPWDKLAYYPEKTIFALDIGGGDNFSTVHFGTEMQMFRWLALRFGINKGVRLGLGLHTGTVKFDYMFSPKMTDTYSNKETENNHAFSIFLRY